MNIYKHRISIPILFTLFAIIIMPAFGADQVSVIQYPLMNRPVIVERGESFQFEINQSINSNWDAFLELPQYNLSWPLSAPTYVSSGSGRYKYQTTVPSTYRSSDIPIELYDLVIKNGSTEIDRVENAVKVIDEYKDDYTFVHLPDCHLPSVAWKLDYVDNNTVTELRQVIREINLLNPEFILQTGDIVNNGENVSEFVLAQDMIGMCNSPMFITGGNHDLWYNAHRHWHQYFGKTMDYDFLYGDTRYIGLEMYDQPTKTYTAQQMSWLVNTLNTSLDNNEDGRIIFTHFDESQQLTGDLVDDYDVKGIVYGHVHQDIEESWGSNSIPKLCTAFTMNDYGHFRIVRVVNGEMVDYPVIAFKNLWTNTYPENDGSSGKVTTVIHNENDEDFTDLLVKVTVDITSGTNFTITGGTDFQYIDSSNTERTYYILADVDANDSTVVTVDNNASPNLPYVTSFDPKFDPDVFAGIPKTFQFHVQDDNNSVSYQWYRDGNAISGATGSSYVFQSRITFQGETTLKVVATAGGQSVSKTWIVYVNKSTSKPIISSSSTRNFALADEPYTISWYETANIGTGRLYMVHSDGGSPFVLEENGPDQVSFTPENESMPLGLYFCKVCVNGICSQEFGLVVETSEKPEMIAPVGNITTFAPVFQWDRVDGVPYYAVLLMDQKLEINEVDDEFEIENATPIWGMLTSATRVTYGAKDSSGYFNSTAPPLEAEHEYSWIVLNCYGNTAELISTNVVPDIETFYIDVDPPELPKPVLYQPANESVLSDPVIRFKWYGSDGASGYHFYPFKIEADENLGEVALPMWDNVITTTDTILDFQASEQMVSGKYKWKVSAVDDDGQEIPSAIWKLEYDAPSMQLDIRTFSMINNRKEVLGRVNITAEAIQGVEQAWPLSTDTEGARDDIVFTPGIYRFDVSKDGFAPLDTVLTLEVNTHPTVEFILEQDPSKIIGQVYQVQNADTLILANANVRVQHSLESDVYRTTLSDQNGRINVSVIPGPYQISATKNGYANSDTVSISVDADTILTLTEDIYLEKYKNRIFGTVLNATGNPVYGANVSIVKNEINYSTSTTANGYFSFQVSDGTWSIKASKSGFITTENRTVAVANGQVKELTPSLVLQRAQAIINGFVNDGLQMVGDAKIKATPLSGSSIEQLSDNYGNFTLSLVPGYYQLSAEKEGYSSDNPVEINIETGQTLSGVEVFLKANASSVSGLVTKDGVIPVENVKVAVNGEHDFTNAGGYYKVNVPAGTYDVQAIKEGYLSESPKTISVSVGQDVEGVNFILSPNASVVKGHVYYNGSAVVNAIVTARNGQVVSTKTNENGFYTLNVEAGTDTITAWKDGFSESDSVLTIGEAQVIEDVDLSIERYVAYINGTVYDVTSGREPLSNVTINVGNNGKSTASNTNGEFQLQVTPSITGYTVTASKSGYSQDQISTGTLTSGSSASLEFEIQKFSTYIKGFVYDNIGNRLENALVIGGADSTYSSSEGQYLLGLTSTGNIQFHVSKIGYTDSSFTKNISLGDQLNQNLELKRDFKHLYGKVYDNATMQPISNASLSLAGVNGVAAFNYITTTNNEGEYSFDVDTNAIIVPGLYNFAVSKTGYSQTSNTLSMTVHRRNMDVSLVRFTSALHGLVLDGDNQPVDSVSVIATHSGGTRYTKITNIQGKFDIEPIEPGNYQIQLTRKGYVFGSSLTRSAATDTIYPFIIYANVGRFQGIVHDAVTSEPINDVKITVKDALGNQGRSTTNPSGEYKITSLPAGSIYQMKVTKWGYHDFIISDTLAYADTTLYTNIFMDPVMGSINGYVKLDTTTGDGIANVLVKLQNDTLYQTYTNATGLFQFSNLEAGEYYLSVNQPGYLSQPTSQKLTIDQNHETVNSNDFVLTEAVVSRIEISAQPLVVGNQGASFSYTALSPSRQQVPIVPQWSVNLNSVIADSTVSESGFNVVFDSTFVGNVWIFIEDTVSQFKDSIKVKVVELLEANNDAIVFKDFKGGQFLFPDNAVSNNVTFGVDHQSAPNFKKNAKVNGELYHALGEIYDLNFNPASAVLNAGKTLELRLPVTETANTGQLTVGKWNEKALNWIALGQDSVMTDQVENGYIRAFRTSLSQYVVLQKALPLGIRNFTAMPNPFSPYDKPIQIEFDVSSDKSDRVLISIDIYNMVGDHVKSLLSERSYLAGDHITVPWSGYTEHLRMAKNGRYLIHIKIDDGVSKKELLKPIVLIK